VSAARRSAAGPPAGSVADNDRWQTMTTDASELNNTDPLNVPVKMQLKLAILHKASCETQHVMGHKLPYDCQSERHLQDCWTIHCLYWKQFWTPETPVQPFQHLVVLHHPADSTGTRLSILPAIWWRDQETCYTADMQHCWHTTKRTAVIINIFSLKTVSLASDLLTITRQQNYRHVSLSHINVTL